MATTVSDSGPAADRYRRAQAALVRMLMRDLRGLRRLIVPARLRQTVPDWIDAVHALVGQYGTASATLAAEHYETQRADAEARGRFTAEPAVSPPDEQVDASLRWALKDVWERDETTASVAQQEPLDVRLEQAQKKAEGVAQRLVLDQGRETVRQAVRRDRDAVAYARAAALGACSFCKLMASRGAVYKTAETAGRDADERFEGNASVVKFHDNCHCAIIPVFRGQRFELSEHAAEWDRLYREYAQGHSGEQLRRFRRALAEHDRYPLPAAH
ncbi:hypothetical protein ACLIYM_25180 [Streptomyces fenghuangensis]